MADHELWSFNNALFFLILIVLVVLGILYGLSSIFDIKKIRANWAEERCSPLIMPFAGLFGYNTKENFEFCMGKIFTTHSTPMLGSMSGMFTEFTSLLTMLFNSISSIRNIIASLGGGINVVFQEFTERISNFFFKLRISAVRIKSLIGRMYAILFSVMYMGMSGITGMTSFTNTFLFSFLDTFCFPEDTIIEVEGRGRIPIKDVQLGDILLPTNSKVTGTFQFFSRGQPMVKLADIIVSTNHYIDYNGKYIKVGNHPDALNIGLWNSDKPLYCLDTDNHKIPIGDYTFLDYDETSEGDVDTMNYIENRINAWGLNMPHKIEYNFTEYCPAFNKNTQIRLKNGIKSAKEIQIGDTLSTGNEVVGVIRRNVTEICKLENGLEITPSTLIWNPSENKWQRLGEIWNSVSSKDESPELVSFVVIPNSQIELENGLVIRDYMELCSPDSELYYSRQLEA